ncbi:hypothetical protein [Pseudonocardia parietis]|uniref:Membrane protein n=1 Tax=Pseudonocardia parietis TaxID=570936 RepID=A0ABS4VX10_9PSEU|nr:hypothetical protein [Pseudonocardia parietis]MBP2368467.1 putative membrane protein [Pseudonocardia parietis]
MSEAGVHDTPAGSGGTAHPWRWRILGRSGRVAAPGSGPGGRDHHTTLTGFTSGFAGAAAAAAGVVAAVLTPATASAPTGAGDRPRDGTR